MAEHRSRSFLSWSLLLVAFLVAVVAFIVMFDRKRESKSEPVQPAKRAALGFHEVNTVAKRIIAKYGQRRMLEDSICLENGNIICVSVQDFIKTEKNRYHFYRAVVHHGLRYATVKLKLPERLDNDQYDTAKWEVDTTELNPYCYTPVIVEEIFTSGVIDMNRHAKANLLIIGLRAGYLISYLHDTYPEMHLTGVEMEPKMEQVARKWFGLVSDDRQQIYTMDGVKFIENAVKEERKYDVIILDACLVGVRPNLDFSCPLKPFLKRKQVENILKALKEKGVVIVNVASYTMYQMVAAEKVMALYEKVFRECTAIPAEEAPPNIVVSCTKHDRPEGLKERYTDFAKSIAKK